MTGYQSKKAAALDEDGMYLVHQTAQPEQEQEPVAFINAEQRTFEWAKPTSWHTPTVVNLPKIPLYTHPQRPWVDLTDKEIEACWNKDLWKAQQPHNIFARAVLAKSKEKNNG